MRLQELPLYVAQHINRKRATQHINWQAYAAQHIICWRVLAVNVISRYTLHSTLTTDLSRMYCNCWGDQQGRITLYKSMLASQRKAKPRAKTELIIIEVFQVSFFNTVQTWWIHVNIFMIK